MNDVQAVYSGTYGTIGIDPKVQGLATACYGLPEQDKQSVNWIGPSSLPAALSEEVMIGLSDVVYQPGLESEEPWSCSTLPENRNVGTTYVYSGAIENMGAENVVSMRDLVGCELCISSNDGQKVFEVLKSAISKGNKVCISFENIKSLSASFLDSAIGQLYNGEIRGDIDEKLSFDNISPGRRLIIERAVREAKAYYSDPEGYLAKMKKIFADD
jgi:hypothetical protein